MGFYKNKYFIEVKEQVQFFFLTNDFLLFFRLVPTYRDYKDYRDYRGDENYKSKSRSYNYWKKYYSYE